MNLLDRFLDLLVADDDDLGAALLDCRHLHRVLRSLQGLLELRRGRWPGASVQRNGDRGQLGVDLIAVLASESHLDQGAHAVGELELGAQEMKQ